MDVTCATLPKPRSYVDVPRPALNPSSIQVNTSLQHDTPRQVGGRSPPQTGAVVIDMGTGTCKVGFAGQARPLYTVATLVGSHPKRAAASAPPELETFIGEAARARPDLTLARPVRGGIVVDWDAAELIWRHLLEHDLRVATSDHPLLFSDPPFSPATNREKLVELAFEALRAPAMFVAAQSVLAVYAHGLVSGLVVDAGHGVSYAAPVFQGYSLPHAAERLDLAGTHLTAFLAETLRGAGLPLGQRDLATVEDIKHRHCYVAPDPGREPEPPGRRGPAALRLPDGRSVALGPELSRCPELLFRPPAVPGLAPLGLPAMAHRSLGKVAPEARAELAANVLLAGGSSLFPGFEPRFRAELQRCGPPPPPAGLGVRAAAARGLAVWVGGSVLASLRAFQTCWVPREQYEEQGPHVVYRRCY